MAAVPGVVADRLNMPPTAGLVPGVWHALIGVAGVADAAEAGHGAAGGHFGVVGLTLIDIMIP